MRGVLACAVVLALASPVHAEDPPSPTPEQKAKARELADSAMRRIRDANDFAGASDLFLQAYDASHELTFLINAAVSQRKALLPQQAIATYKRVLAEGGSALAPDLKAQVESDIAIVTREAGQLDVRTEGPPAEILLDQRVAGTASKDAPLFVLVAPDAGRQHTIIARRPGFKDAVHTLERLTIGSPTEIELVPTVIPQIAVITIVTVPTGAELARSTGEKYGRAPQTRELPPGEYTFTATLGGYKDAHDRATLAAGETRKLELVLEALPDTWWHRHKLGVVIGSGVAVVAVAAVVGWFAFKPDYGQRIDYP